MFDGHRNFSSGRVKVGPSPATTGTTLTLRAGEGAKMAAVPFNAPVWPQGEARSSSNTEIVRVTDVDGDTLTIIRAQEGTPAKAINSLYQLENGATAKIFTDIEAKTIQAGSGCVLYVDGVTGSDALATAEPGRADLPFKTIAAAKLAASAGYCIEVCAGTYAENNLMKAGISYYFRPGAVVSYVDPGTGPGYGIFDDRASGAAGKFTVEGVLEIVYREVPTQCHGSTPVSNANVLGAIVITNGSSSGLLRVTKITMGHPKQVGGIWVTNCSEMFFEVPEVTSTFETFPCLDLDSDPLDPDTVNISEQCVGVYWKQGEMHATVRRVTTNVRYGLYCDEPLGGASTNLYYTGDLINSAQGVAVYCNTNSANYRVWINCAQIIINNATNGCMNLLGPGRIYVTTQKLSGLGSGVTAGGELWLTAEKISAGTVWVSALSGSKVHVTCQHFEDIGAVNGGFSNVGGELYVHGGYAKLGTAVGATAAMVTHASGTTRLRGVTLDASLRTTSTNRPVTCSGAGLILQDCTIICGSAIDASVYAASAQTVKVYGTTVTNKAKHANVTVAVGTLLVDGAVT